MERGYVLATLLLRKIYSNHDFGVAGILSLLGDDEPNDKINGSRELSFVVILTMRNFIMYYLPNV